MGRAGVHEVRRNRMFGMGITDILIHCARVIVIIIIWELVKKLLKF